VLIWKGKGRDVNRGIVAFGEVRSEPEKRPDSENPFWIHPPSPDELEERVWVHYVVTPQLPIWEPHPALAALSVSRARGGTVFNLTRDQWNEIVQIAGGWPFPEEQDSPSPTVFDLVPHRRYRRSDLHAHFGGQRQGGISTPTDWPFVFLFSTPSGDRFGYHDGWTEDGVYSYTGEGQIGDMQFIRGNLAIRQHSEMSKDLLLFEGQGDGWVEFVGRVAYVGHHIEQAPDRNGSPRAVIIFDLAPAELFQSDQLERSEGAAGGVPETLRQLDLSSLRKKALDDATDDPSSAMERLRRVRVRSQAVRLYALRRAMGVCEGCHGQAPFVTLDGEPFLEVHHLRRISDGGPDRPDAVAAVCPNCHRRSHYAADAHAFNREVEMRVRAKEEQLGFTV
jgi:5-methylcytosine-specific restriction protein A